MAKTQGGKGGQSRVLTYIFAEMRSRLKRLTPGWTEGALITAEREVAAVEKKKLERKREIGVLKEHRGDIVDCQKIYHKDVSGNVRTT